MSSMQPCLNDSFGVGHQQIGIERIQLAEAVAPRHMPCGLLKLKSCGLGGSKLRPQCVQA